MNEAPSNGTSQPISAHVVEVNGCFGTVLWSVEQQLFAILPRRDRDQVLAMTGNDIVGPFFERTVDKLLEQVAYSGPPSSSFCPDSSLETVESNCLYGQVIWQISQGLWDAIPDDQRSALLDIVQELIHAFFHLDVQRPLQSYALRKLHG